jgi:hypothetical protein
VTEQLRRWSDHGAVVGPLAGARAPQWVSMLPSSGLATAPPWLSPASNCPRLGSSSPAPAKGYPDAWHGRSPFPLFPFSDLSCICFLFFSLVHPKRRSSVRVRLNLIHVFFWFDSRSLRLSPSPLPLLFF